MDGLGEEQAKEQCREIFYAALPARMELAVQIVGGASLIDTVMAGHSLLEVLYDAPKHTTKLQIFPVRTYEILRELREKAEAKQMLAGIKPTAADEVAVKITSYSTFGPDHILNLETGEQVPLDDSDSRDQQAEAR